MSDDDLEREIAGAVELPKLEYRPISEYVDGTFAVFRARWSKAFGVGRGGEFREIVDGERDLISWEPEEFAPVADDQIVAFAFS